MLRRAVVQWPLLLAVLAVMVCSSALVGTSTLLIGSGQTTALAAAAERADGARAGADLVTVTAGVNDASGTTPPPAAATVAELVPLLRDAAAPFAIHTSVWAASPPMYVPGDVSRRTYLLDADTAEAHATLTQGRWPRATAAGDVIEVVLPRTAAIPLGLGVGSRVSLEASAEQGTSTQLVVVGLADLDGSSAWRRDPIGGAGVSTSGWLPLYGPCLVAPGSLLAADAPAGFLTSWPTSTCRVTRRRWPARVGRWTRCGRTSTPSSATGRLRDRAVRAVGLRGCRPPPARPHGVDRGLRRAPRGDPGRRGPRAAGQADRRASAFGHAAGDRTRRQPAAARRVGGCRGPCPRRPGDRARRAARARGLPDPAGRPTTGGLVAARDPGAAAGCGSPARRCGGGRCRDAGPGHDGAGGPRGFGTGCQGAVGDRRGLPVWGRRAARRARGARLSPAAGAPRGPRRPGPGARRGAGALPGGRRRPRAAGAARGRAAGRVARAALDRPDRPVGGVAGRSRPRERRDLPRGARDGRGNLRAGVPGHLDSLAARPGGCRGRRRRRRGRRRLGGPGRGSGRGDGCHGRDGLGPAGHRSPGRPRVAARCHLGQPRHPPRGGGAPWPGPGRSELGSPRGRPRTLSDRHAQRRRHLDHRFGDRCDDQRRCARLPRDTHPRGPGLDGATGPALARRGPARRAAARGDGARTRQPSAPAGPLAGGRPPPRGHRAVRRAGRLSALLDVAVRLVGATPRSGSGAAWSVGAHSDRWRRHRRSTSRGTRSRRAPR